MQRHTARAVAQYLLRKGALDNNTLTPMQLLKLVYIAHGWMLGLYSRPLINEQVEAWQYGPVIRDLYNAIKHYRSAPVESIEAPEEVFDGLETALLDQVYNLYGRFTGPQLSTLTHAADTPWDLTWRHHGKNSVISNDLIEEHYAALYRRYSAGANQQKPARTATA